MTTDEFLDSLAALDRRMSVVHPESEYAAMSELERDLYDVNCFNFELNVGGLATYFGSTAGAHWRRTSQALARIDARPCSALLSKAAAAFPGGMPAQDEDELHNQLSDSALQEVLSDLDFELDRCSGELLNLLERYWRAHASRQT